MLQNWPIRSKLVAILILPLVALTAFSAVQVRANLDNVSASDRIRALAGFSIKVNDLVDALQQERFTVAAYVGSGYQSSADSAVAIRKQVDPAIETYRTGAADLPAAATKNLRVFLDAIASQIDRLATQRRLIDTHEAQNEKTSEFYTAFIGDLLDLNAQVASGSKNADLVRAAATLVSMSRAKEALRQQAGYVAVILFLHQSNVGMIKLIQSNAGAEDAWITQFHATASQPQRDFFDQAVQTKSESVAQMRDNTVFAAQTGRPATVPPTQWLNVTGEKAGVMRDAERRIANDLSAQSESIASGSRQNAWFNGVGVLIVLVVSIGVALLVASPMIRHLRRLRRAALEIADERLPSVVKRLHQGEQVEIEAEVFPVGIRTRDEIGQVSDAFNTVHQVAVRTAVEQAAMRKSIGDTFLNLARRSQALIHRQLKVIDALERKETDPDELAELFRLDHLATRMRRHAEDLIVLSGSKPARGWRRPVPIKDVVRGAVAEVEDYTRVKVLPITGSAIGGHAVGDVIHMLAELIENATSFSPPHTPVHVSGHEVSNGSVIEVEDRGLGMTDEEYGEINDRLSNPPPFDLRTSERLGLFVVGRLAQRHGIQVRLRPSPYGGTLAIVLLPASLLREVDDTAQAAPAASRPERVGAPVLGPSLDGSIALSDPTSLSDSLSLMNDPVSLDNPLSLDDSVSLSESISLSDSVDTSELLSVSASTMPSTGGAREDRPLMDDLPVFPTIRSSWFVSEHDELGGADADTGGSGIEHPRGRLRSNPSVEPSTWVEPPSGSPAPPPLPSTRWDDGPPAAHPERSQPADRWADPPDPPQQRGLPARRRTGSTTDPFPAGGPALPQASALPAARPAKTEEPSLPKRKRRASLAPELRGTPPVDSVTPPLLAGSRSPDEIRSMMSSFQSNFGRGLQEGPNPNGSDDAKKVM